MVHSYLTETDRCILAFDTFEMYYGWPWYILNVRTISKNATNQLSIHKNQL